MKSKTLIAAFLLCAGLLSGCGSGQDAANPGPADQVSIYIGNDLYETVPFGTPQVIEVEQKNGMVNEVTLTEDAVFMSSASCDNQDCVHQGHITLENYEQRPLGQWIICLPNQVTIELVPAAETEAGEAK